jgi:flavin-dependent dehydrogenase
VDRRRFDAMLARAAEEAGATLYSAARVTACTRTPEGNWRLETLCDGRSLSLQAGILVEATGRSSLPAPANGARRRVYDRLVGIVGFVARSDAAAPQDPRLLLEAAEHGWWYSAPLPDDRMVVAYMTDADHMAGVRRRLAAFWRERLGEALYTRERLASYRREPELRIVSANSYQRERVAAGNRLAVGDAAMAFDPLSSQGICKALHSGMAAAEAILASRRGRADAIEQYARDAAAGFSRYLQARTAYYRQEGRWPNSEFWRRRHE